MAVAPKVIEDNFENSIKEFEKEIDDNLKKKIVLTNSYISINIPEGMTKDHFYSLRLRYMEVGWKNIEWIHETWEKDWLCFEV